MVLKKDKNIYTHMKYRDFYKNNNNSWKKYIHLLPEGVNPDEFKKGIEHEKEHTDDEFMAAKIAGDHLDPKNDGDPKYYSKLDAAGLEEKELIKGIKLEDSACDDGLPKCADGSLDIEPEGMPVKLAKIVKFGFGDDVEGGDTGGEGIDVEGDKEPITAAGTVDPNLASKTVGDKVVDGEGQKQGGPNTKGNIEGTPKLDGSDCGCECDSDIPMSPLQETKSKIRKYVKEALKEVKFNKETGKWEKINENVKGSIPNDRYETCVLCKGKKIHPRTGAKCDFCNGYGLSRKEEDWNYPNGVDYHMALSKADNRPKDRKPSSNYGTDVEHPDFNENSISNIKLDINKIRDIEVGGVDTHDYPDFSDAYVVSAVYPVVNNPKGPNDWRDLTEEELDWLNNNHPEIAHKESHKSLNETDMKMGPSYKVVQPRMYKISDDDFARTNQYDPEITEMYDEEEHSMCESRYNELITAKRNLSESELQELKELGFKMNKMNNLKNEELNYDASGNTSPGDVAGMRVRKSKPLNTDKMSFDGPNRSLGDVDIDPVDREGDDGSFPEEPDFGPDVVEDVNMKMGPSYKKVQKTLAKTSNDDFARTNQYDPEISEEVKKDYKNCPKCKRPLKLSVGGVSKAQCSSCGEKIKDDQLKSGGFPTNEAGGFASQQKSFRTANDMPQLSKNRHKGNLDEAKKVKHTCKSGGKPCKACFAEKNAKKKAAKK